MSLPRIMDGVYVTGTLTAGGTSTALTVPQGCTSVLVGVSGAGCIVNLTQAGGSITAQTIVAGQSPFWLGCSALDSITVSDYAGGTGGQSYSIAATTSSRA